MRIHGERILDVYKRTVELAAMHLDQRPQTQKGSSIRSLLVELADFLLRHLQLLICRALVAGALVKIQQVHVQLNAVKRSFGRLSRKTLQRGFVFVDCIRELLPHARDLSANGVESVVSGVNRSRAIEK